MKCLAFQILVSMILAFFYFSPIHLKTEIQKSFPFISYPIDALFYSGLLPSFGVFKSRLLKKGSFNLLGDDSWACLKVQNTITASAPKK
jgi:hypothetical protein